MEEVLKYIRQGYPSEFGFEFAATVDQVRHLLKDLEQRPENVESLLWFAKGVFHRFDYDPRLPASVVAKMIGIGCIRMESNGKIIYHEDKLWDR